MMDLKELQKKLPYKWRVQSTTKGATPYAACVAYIDARDVQDLLDEVVGPANWKDEYTVVKGNLYAGIAIKCDGEWVWKYDCGTESNTEAQKGEASDAFKRAAVKWGVGRFLYDLDLVWLNTKQQGDKYLPVDDKGNILKSKADVTRYIHQLNDKKGTALKDGTREAPEPTAPPVPVMPNPTPPRTGGLNPVRTPIDGKKSVLSEKGLMTAVERIKAAKKEKGVDGATATLEQIQSTCELTEQQLKILKIAVTNDLAAA